MVAGKLAYALALEACICGYGFFCLVAASGFLHRFHVSILHVRVSFSLFHLRFLHRFHASKDQQAVCGLKPNTSSHNDVVALIHFCTVLRQRSVMQFVGNLFKNMSRKRLKTVCETKVRLRITAFTGMACNSVLRLLSLALLTRTCLAGIGNRI